MASITQKWPHVRENLQNHQVTHTEPLAWGICYIAGSGGLIIIMSISHVCQSWKQSLYNYHENKGFSGRIIVHTNGDIGKWTPWSRRQRISHKPHTPDTLVKADGSELVGKHEKLCAPGCQQRVTKGKSLERAGKLLLCRISCPSGIHLQPVTDHVGVHLRLLLGGRNRWTARATGREQGLAEASQAPGHHSSLCLTAPPVRQPLLHFHFPNLIQVPLAALTQDHMAKEVLGNVPCLTQERQCQVN